MAYVLARRPTNPIKGRGLSGYRRGLGACGNPNAQGIGTDDATGETCVVIGSSGPGSSGPSTTVNVPAGSSQTVTQWLNANQSTVLIGGAAFLGLMLFARSGR